MFSPTWLYGKINPYCIDIHAKFWMHFSVMANLVHQNDLTDFLMWSCYCVVSKYIYFNKNASMIIGLVTFPWSLMTWLTKMCPSYVLSEEEDNLKGSFISFYVSIIGSKMLLKMICLELVNLVNTSYPFFFIWINKQSTILNLLASEFYIQLCN